MSTQPGPSCAKCGAELAAFATEGFCSACLLEQGLLSNAPAPAPLSRFGNYELIEEIARGGMGVVYKARQAGLDRFVAVKMILSGQFASAAEMQRFRTEARAAAALQHPGIVAIHEVGEHDGLLFFSMDYIEGRNLAQLVRDSPWPAARAAQCVRDIAEAIHYAHERGVLHRDLKPSNVLIDAEGKPRVTDFGLAKRLPNSELETQNSELTLSGQVLGSPNFMPPEQAAGKHRELTPAADVYSLGALLYHLITGRAPFLSDSISATLRLVADAEPVGPRLLVPTVPRDLETICLKCLEKDPAHRYASARELAEELDRFINYEPIQARAVGGAEKVWRWCRRKPAIAGAYCAAAALLLIVAIGSPIAAFRIDRERRRADAARKNEIALREQAEAEQKKAQAAASKSQQVAEFLKDTLKSVGPSVALGRDTKMLREILDKTVERLGKDLQAQPVVEADLRMIVGSVYDELELAANAEIMFRRALALRIEVLGSQHPDVAATRNLLGEVLRQRNKLPEAEQMLREGLALRQKLFGVDHPDTARSMNNLATVFWNQGKLDAAEAMHLQAMATYKKLGDETLDAVEVYNNLGIVLGRQRKWEAAEAIFHEGLAMGKKSLGSDHPLVALTTDSLANLLWGQGKLEEAELRYREASAIRIKVLGYDHSWTTASLNHLSGVLVAEQKSEAADKLFESLLKPSLSQTQSAGLLRLRASFRAQVSRFNEAATDLSEAIKLVPDEQWNWYQRAPVLIAGGDLVGYRKHCGAMLDRFYTTRNPATAERTGKACLLIPGEGTDLARAAHLVDVALDLGKEDKDLPWFILTKGLAEYRQGHFSNAADWAAKALLQRERDYYRDTEAYTVLAMALHQLKQTDKARAALAESAETARTKLPKLNSGRLESRHNEWLIAKFLFEEATTLIEMPSDNDPFKVKE